jgi:putative transposase
MGRPKRVDVGGLVYHVLNRGNGRMDVFEDDGDYEAFERVLAEAVGRVDMRLLGYCLMPNHWHLVLWPRRDGDLRRFVGWATLTHTQRWHAHRHSTGGGHVYQGRYKSFVVQEDGHLLSVLRYVEANPLRAGLVESAEDWRWGSLSRWLEADAGMERPALADWPVARPRDWRARVNRRQDEAQVRAIREAARRGRPVGDERYVKRMVARFDLGETLRPRGRPRKGAGKGS